LYLCKTFKIQTIASIEIIEKQYNVRREKDSRLGPGVSSFSLWSEEEESVKENKWKQPDIYGELQVPR
jgi:hypothetical protein